MSKKLGHLDFEARVREKQAARDVDEDDLRSGRRSAAEVTAANDMFAALGRGALRNAKIRFPEKK